MNIEPMIGSYKILEKIGEGGMGIVYLAEQSRPVSRRVALKVVKPGMDSREILARFDAERQALALMDHPSIARVLDVGTTDAGRPYFVMELVKGTPLTTYCDEKRLSLRERLELFLPVCQAVQHAHQKGIIHRDLKPSNVLVAQYDSRPLPKIIDFGLAKAIGRRLTDKTMFTQFGQIVGTIHYMSPEQASFNQLDIDTRSDIYSLGVVLYELLTGETPFDKRRLNSVAADEMLRIIRQEEPPRPSQRVSSHESLPAIAAKRGLEPRKLSSLVRGELDWIVMKAIEKDRDRRYETARALAEDIRRYLDQEAVLACPPSFRYRFQKFARRHVALLAAAATVVVALLAGLAGTTWALAKAIEAEELAKVELAKAKTAYVSQTERNLVQAGRVMTFEQFRDSFCQLLDRGLSARVSRSNSSSEDVEMESLRRGLLLGVAEFWRRMVEFEVDPSGGPSVHAGRYRVQCAVALARAGEHNRAHSDTEVLARELSHDTRWLADLIRVCSLCAAAAADDPGLVDLYVDSGIVYLKQAADEAAQPPLEADDPDLEALTAHADFRPELEKWIDGWQRYAPKTR